MIPEEDQGRNICRYFPEMYMSDSKFLPVINKSMFEVFILIFHDTGFWAYCESVTGGSGQLLSLFPRILLKLNPLSILASSSETFTASDETGASEYMT